MTGITYTQLYSTVIRLLSYNVPVYINTVGNICIYNIVYVVYRTAVDGLSGLMFGGFTSRTPPFLVLLGWMCPSHPCLFLMVKVQHYGDWEDPACGAIECVG